MKTISNNSMFAPSCLLLTLTFCLVGCGSPEQETSTPQQSDSGVVEMEIKTPDDKTSSNEETTADATEDAASDDKTAPPKSGSDSSADATEGSSGLSLTPPKS